jgi:hypothetical protein
MRCGKETRHVLAEDTPPPLLQLATSLAFPHLIHKIEVGAALVFATDTVAAHAFL